MKWEPLVAMLAMVGLGLWLVWGPSGCEHYELRPGAATVQVRLPTRGVIESVTDPASGATSFRVLTRDGHVSPVLDAQQFRDLVGPEVFRAATRTTWLFRVFNITSWWSLIWVALGLGGQAAFSGRTLIQWFVSEKHRRSVVPAVFWWLSLGGGLLLFAYFAWRQDVVGVMGQAPGVVVYARNLRLIRKHARRIARQVGAESPPA